MASRTSQWPPGPSQDPPRTLQWPPGPSQDPPMASRTPKWPPGPQNGLPDPENTGKWPPGPRKHGKMASRTWKMASRTWKMASRTRKMASRTRRIPRTYPCRVSPRPYLCQRVPVVGTPGMAPPPYPRAVQPRRATPRQEPAHQASLRFVGNEGVHPLEGSGNGVKTTNFWHFQTLLCAK